MKTIHCVATMAAALLLAVMTPAHAVPVPCIADFSFTGTNPTPGKATGSVGFLANNALSNGLYTADFVGTMGLVFGDGTPGSTVQANTLLQ